MMARCPICRRHVVVSYNQTALTHTDKTGHLCPFSGQPLSTGRKPK